MNESVNVCEWEECYFRGEKERGREGERERERVADRDVERGTDDKVHTS
jgi:hypothetical protein